MGASKDFSLLTDPEKDPEKLEFPKNPLVFGHFGDFHFLDPLGGLGFRGCRMNP